MKRTIAKSFLLSPITLLASFRSVESMSRVVPHENNGIEIWNSFLGSVTTSNCNGKQVCICCTSFIGPNCEDYACVNGLSTSEQFDPTSTFFNNHCLTNPDWTGELCVESLINRCGINGEERSGKCACGYGFLGEDRCQYVTQCLQGQLFNYRCCARHYDCEWKGDFCDYIIRHQGHANMSHKKFISPTKYRGYYCDLRAPELCISPSQAKIGRRRQMILIDGDNIPITLLAVAITIVLVVVSALFYVYCSKISMKKKVQAKTKQSNADIGSGSQNSTYKNYCPLSGGTQLQVIGTGLSLNVENFYDHHPSSLDTFAPANMQQQNAFEHTMEEANVAAELEFFAETVRGQCAPLTGTGTSNILRQIIPCGFFLFCLFSCVSGETENSNKRDVLDKDILVTVCLIIGFIFIPLLIFLYKNNELAFNAARRGERNEIIRSRIRGNTQNGIYPTPKHRVLVEKAVETADPDDIEEWFARNGPLICHFMDSTEVVGQLVARKVLRKVDAQKIKIELIDYVRNEKLVDILSMKDWESFKNFVEILGETGHEQLLRLIIAKR